MRLKEQVGELLIEFNGEEEPEPLLIITFTGPGWTTQNRMSIHGMGPIAALETTLKYIRERSLGR